MAAGVTSTEGLLESLALGAPTLPIGINIGVANRVATFKTTGIRVLNAAKDVGVPLDYSVNLINFGAYYANLYSTTANIDVDQACATGYISGFIGGTYNATNLEYVIRPLWCMLSSLIKDLKDKKVI